MFITAVFYLDILHDFPRRQLADARRAASRLPTSYAPVALARRRPRARVDRGARASSIARPPATTPCTASTPASARSPKRAIPRDALGALQLNLLRSHAAGVGEPLPVRAVRASMALRANVLAKGFSGIRRIDARSC